LGSFGHRSFIHILPGLPFREVLRAFSGERALAPDLSGLGVIVYSACWFYRIDFILEIVRRVWEYLASAESTLNWQAIGSLLFLLFVLPILGGAMFSLIGGATMFIPFIFIGPSVAFCIDGYFL